jgi:hypothetical protein
VGGWGQLKWQAIQNIGLEFGLWCLTPLSRRTSQKRVFITLMQGTEKNRQSESTKWFIDMYCTTARKALQLNFG